MINWRSILTTAIQSPSPHNVQPWRVRILSESEAELFIDLHRTLPKEDVTGSFIILTMGMFIEALGIAASNQGLKIEYDLLREPAWYAATILNPGGEQFLPFARLHLNQADGAASRYPNSLFHTRRTSRITLTGRAVPKQAAQTLSELAAEFGQRYEQIVDPAIIATLLDLNIQAVFADLNAPGYHDEIVEWFRFSQRSARRHRDGLDYRCMNASRTAFWLSARFPQLMKFRPIRPLLWKIYRAQLGIVPTIGILAGGFWEPTDAFKTGRFLMRFWLETALQGLYLHPYGNLVTNHAAAELTLAETGIAGAWLIFKIGYSKEPPKSYRRTVEEILID